jgi:hypothetical protein
MTLTKKVCFYMIIGSFISWGIWMMMETTIGNGFASNRTGLVFGLTLSGLALFLYYLYFRLQKQGFVLSILAFGCLFSITMYVLSYFDIVTSH